MAYVAVIGPDAATAEESATAERVGQLLAQRNCVVICGGLGGVMEAACRGVKNVGGTAVGLLPGGDRAQGNAFLSVALATGLGELRNGLVVNTSDAVIAVGGSWGTLSEVALAVRASKPTIVINGWDVRDPAQPSSPVLRQATSAEEAVQLALSMIDASGKSTT